MTSDNSRASSAAMVHKVLQILDIVRGSPAGAVIYRQVEQVLEDLEAAHLEAERVYAGLLYALLDAYLQHLPADSPLSVQVRVLQQRLQPPLGLFESESLYTQLKVYAEHIAKMREQDIQHLGQALAPLLSPEDQAGFGVAGAEPTHGRSADRGADSYTLPRSDYGVSESADDQHSEVRRLQESLSREIRETIAQNQEFGVMLDLVMGELQHVDTLQDVEDIRWHLLDQVKRLHQGHYALAERLDSADRYLRIIERDSRHLNEELSRARQMSLTDELTVLPNRRAFLNRLEDEVARVQRYGMSLSMAMIDLDNFKEINDRYGHAAGDEVLKCYADKIFSVFRHHDLVARYGGEEFAVLLPNTDSEGASRALDKIKERAANMYCSSELVSIRMPTFSAGLVVYAPGEPPHALIERADRALYRAKRLGRNRVEIEAAGPSERKDDSSPEDAEHDRPPSSSPSFLP